MGCQEEEFKPRVYETSRPMQAGSSEDPTYSTATLGSREGSNVQVSVKPHEMRDAFISFVRPKGKHAATIQANPATHEQQLTSSSRSDAMGTSCTGTTTCIRTNAIFAKGHETK